MSDAADPVDPPDYDLLNELFSRDPDRLTKTTAEERAVIIEHYRAKKHLFDAAALEGKKPSRAKAAPKAKAPSTKGTLSADAMSILGSFKL